MSLSNFHFNFFFSVIFECFIHRGNIIDDWSYEQFYDAYERLFTPGTKTGVYFNRGIYAAILGGTNRSEYPKRLPKRFRLDQRALFFPPHHLFYDAFDKKMQQLVESDLIEYHVRRCFEKINPKRYEKYKEPFKILTIGELEAGFVVSLVPLLLSLIVFCLEWLPTLKNLIVFSHAFNAYFRMKMSDRNFD